MLVKEAIDEFKKLYKEKFGKELEEKEALERALKFLNLYQDNLWVK